MLNVYKIFLFTLFFLPATGLTRDEPGFNDKTFEGLKWRSVGPAMKAGRISDIAIHPNQKSTWYIGVASGGIWKTSNRGTTWETVFDDQGSYSIGCITIDPNNPETIWVGTGENVSGRHVGYGDGVYKSLDGGANWVNTGLADSQHIGMIRVDPRDSNVIYVAAQGPLWSGGGDRGLYKSIDAGSTWKLILSAGKYTGANEVHLDPRNPDVIYAVLHQRFRNVAVLINGGPESAIHKSTDAGKTWRKLEKGLPKEDMGKIGLTISPQKPDVIYATIELKNRTGGFWRSTDGGESWEKRNDYVSGGTGPHYYQEIFASPHRFDRVYQMDNTMRWTNDGGTSFVKIPQKTHHGDHHALAFDADDPAYLMVGTDGGLYESFDLGKTWKFFDNMPITQFYKVSVDYDEPFYNIYGGTQDNGSQGGPSRTDNVHGIRSSDWFVTLFADGHQSAADPTNPNIIYAETQQGGMYRTDRISGEKVFIQPQPAENEATERFNWDSPILISPHNAARLYFASQRVWRSDDRGDSWTPISGDLSRGLDRLKMPVMDRLWSFDSAWDLSAMSRYGTISSLSESALVEGLIYAGTDDGRVQVSEDGGENWRIAGRLPNVPGGYFVNDVKADLHDADSVYLVVDDHKSGDFSPYVLKSVNRGRTWRRIDNNLPDRHVVWRLVQDHVNANLLFVGTEFGVFFTVNGGEQWVKLSGGVPNIAFRDLAIQKRENDLVGASFGRSFYVLDDYTALRQVSMKQLQRQATLFPVRTAPWYIPQIPLGSSEVGSKSSLGDDYFVAPNPPFGAIFTYYLNEEIKTAQARRRVDEKELEKEGGDTPFPGWEAIRQEQIEEPPEVVFTVRNESDDIVAQVTGPVKAGFHRVAWNLRYPGTEIWKPKGTEQDGPGRTSASLAAPGQYSVNMAIRSRGELRDTGNNESFEVIPVNRSTLAGASPDQVVRFTRKLDKLVRESRGAVAAIKEVIEELAAIKQTLLRSPADESLRSETRALELTVLDLQIQLSGNETRENMGDPGSVSISNRIGAARRGTTFSTYGPTATHIEQFQIAEDNFAVLKRTLNKMIEVDLPALRRKLDSAGVPWTPGRGAPGTD